MLVVLLALSALGIGAAALVLGGLGLVCVGLARLALRRGRQADNAALPAPLTGRELQRVKPPPPDGADAGPDIVVRRYRP
jgi:hypothetical protein